MAAPRAVLNRDPALSTTGDVQEAASVYVYEDSAGVTLFASPMYDASTGGNLLANPFSSGAQGSVTAYTQYPRRCFVKVGAGSIRPAAFEADPAYTDSGLGKNRRVDMAAFGADLTGATSAASVLTAALAEAVTNKVPVYFPAGIYNFSTAGFTISTTYNGCTLLLERGAIIKGRDQALTFSIAANDFTIDGGEWTRIGTTAASYLGHMMNVSGDRFTFKNWKAHSLGGYALKCTGADPRVEDWYVKECGLLNRSNLTMVGAGVGPPLNIHPEPGSAVLFNASTNGKISRGKAEGCGGPTINLGSSGGGHVLDDLQLIGAARTSTITVTTTQAGGVGVNEIQRVAITSTCKTGSWYLQFGANATPIMPIDYTAASLSAELQLLASIGVGNVSVTGAFPTWDVEFIGALAATNVSLMTTSSHYLDQQENGIYDTGNTRNHLSNIVVQNFANEGVLLKGGHTTVNGLALKNDVDSDFSIGLSFYPTGPFTVNGLDADFTNVAQGIICTSADLLTTVNDVVIDGVNLLGGRLQVQTPVDGLKLSNGFGTGGFYYSVNSGKAVANLSIEDFCFRDYNDAAGCIIAAANMVLENVTFENITAAAGLFERLATDRENITANNCRIVGSAGGVKAVVYGIDTGMLADVGDRWWFVDCDWQDLALSTTSLVSTVPMLNVPPRRVGNSIRRVQYSIDQAVDGGATLVFGPFSATGATNPIGIFIRLVGRVGNNVEMATVAFVKGNNVASAVSYAAGPNATGVAFTAGGGDFTATGTGNETLSVTYTNPNAAGTIVRLTADVLALLR